MSSDSTIKIYSIYALIHPDTGIPYYVGKTSNPRGRFLYHLNNIPLWFTGELLKAGKLPSMKVLQQHSQNNARIVELLERAWINRCLDRGYALANTAYRKNNDVRFKYEDSNRVIISSGVEVDCGQYEGASFLATYIARHHRMHIYTCDMVLL